MTRALTSLAGTLAAIPDSARILLTRPGDTELPATVIQDREWLAGQIRLRGQIWGIDDRRTLATLWWYSASTMLVTPGILAIATDGTCLSPRLDHIDIHHQPDSRFSGSHGTRALPEDDLGAFAAELRSTLGTVIGQQQVGRWRARHRRPRGHQGLAGGPRPGSGISRGTRDSTARAALVSRYQAVAPVLKVLPGVIPFGASAEGAPVLAAMQALPDVLAYRSRLKALLIPRNLIDAGLVPGPWRRLVFGHPKHEDGAVSRHAYAFCVLEQFWRHLKRREIGAGASTRWRSPQAQLLYGKAWTAIGGDVLTSLGLPGDPGALLAGHADALDAAYREVAGRLAVNTEVTIGDDGKIHLTGLKAVEEPPSLTDLRKRTAAMLPRVDLPEVILEIMSWAPEVAAAFTAASGGRTRLDDLPTSIAACLAAHAMNVGYRPITKKGVPALERSRLSHVFQNYVRPETLSAANAPLVARQAGLPLAQA